MHNLFLGTAKTMFKLWSNRLANKELEKIEYLIKTIDIPNALGQLPANISANHGSYTAEQWKNWTLTYSLVCLKDILPDKEFKCWQTFVLACKYICQGVISETDLNIADGLFLKFCREVETIYGKHCIKPNMHLHCHLKEILIDHGPVSNFWCFSFERFNGILGSAPTNKRSVELQLMRRFQLSRFVDRKTLPTYFKDELFPLCTVNNNINICDEWLANSSWADRYAFHNLATVSPLPTWNVWRNESGVFCPSSHKLTYLDKDEATLLLKVYNVMYPDILITSNDMNQHIQKFGCITVGTTAFGSKMETRSVRCSKILASWHSRDGSINVETFSLTPGIVRYFFKHAVNLEELSVDHTLACVRWCKEDDNISEIGNPVQVWSAEYVEGGPSCFIPVQRIHSRYTSAKLQPRDKNRITMSAILRKVFL